jgi:glutathione S-transferase
MSLYIYGVPASRAIRVYWMAEELGLGYESVPIDFKDDSTGPTGKNNPAFRAANPMGRVPAMDDGTVKLFESMAITLYLARKHGQGKLWPATIEGEGRAFQWSFFAVTELDALMIEWARNAIVLPAAERDAAKAAAALEKLARPFGVLEAVLARTPFLEGEAFTVSDLNVSATMFRARKMDLAKYPNIARWMAACFGRPAARRAWALRGE